MSTQRPTTGEYPERYMRYIDLVPEHDLHAAMAGQLQATDTWLQSIPAGRADYRYAPDKWTLRDVVGHVLDTERLFGFRLLSIARGDPTPLAIADENLWMRHSEFKRYSLVALADELRTIRQSHVSMVQYLPVTAWDRVGLVGGTNVSVRALGYTMLGHERHHWNIVRTRYLHEI